MSSLRAQLAVTGRNGVKLLPVNTVILAEEAEQWRK
jgi:hypothetical protein